MTYKERNSKVVEPINKLIDEFKAIHDKYTSSSKVLSNEEWEEYVYTMSVKTNDLQGTTLFGIANELWMYFLNDTEYVQKELKKL